MAAALTTGRRPRRRGPGTAAGAPGKRIGGLVLGGDSQGLGIARSLGAHGVPVCVIDDEHSIARYSRYTTRAVRVPDLRNEARTVACVEEIGRRFGLDGWVLFPTRDETVAAFSRHRPQLARQFRVPAPAWRTAEAALDKRQTYRLCEQIGIPAPRSLPSDLGPNGSL